MAEAQHGVQGQQRARQVDVFQQQQEGGQQHTFQRDARQERLAVPIGTRQKAAENAQNHRRP